MIHILLSIIAWAGVACLTAGCLYLIFMMRDMVLLAALWLFGVAFFMWAVHYTGLA